MIKSQTMALMICIALLSLARGLDGQGLFSNPETKPKPHAEFLRVLKAAEQGDAQAQCIVAEAYVGTFGSYEGVSQNDREAATWYRRAAEEKYPRAQASLGDLYRWGRGVPKDFLQAVNYYRMAAEQGDWSAQWSLGHCYRDGEGVAQDWVEAYKWMNVA